jgi:hypothetical protein
MAQTPKITTGPNERARNDTIGQSGEGLPDDTSQPIDVDEAEVERIREKLLGDEAAPSSGAAPAAEHAPAGSANPDMVPADTPGAAENICRRCGGTGQAEGGTCADCDGSGKVMTPVGGAG